MAYSRSGDYVVAISRKTGGRIKLWRGSRFRAFSPSEVVQYKIAMADSGPDAAKRAEKIHQQLSRISMSVS